MQSSYLVIGIVALIIIVGGIFLFTYDTGDMNGNTNTPTTTGTFGTPPTSTTTNGTSSTNTGTNTSTGGTGGTQAKTVTVQYSESGFSPASVTVSQGDTVRFVNSSSRDFWPASAVHPTHAEYDGTSLQQHCAGGTSESFDACGRIAPGNSYSFTFDTPGIWSYHDHLSASHTGSVEVE